MVGCSSRGMSRMSARKSDRVMRRSTRNFNIPPPPPPGKPRAFELLKIGSFKFPPLGPKWCSNALPYRRICLSNAPPKERSLSAPVMSYYKNHNFNIETNDWNLNLLSRTMSISKCKLL